MHFIGMPYVIALAAYGYKTGIEWQDWEIVTDPQITRFANRVSFKGHPEYATRNITTVEVKAKGRTFKDEMIGGLPKLTDEELVSKYRHNASRAITQNNIAGSLKTLLELENVAHVEELMSQITL
jgi:2-methylcitrate dehydratase PrpD